MERNQHKLLTYLTFQALYIDDTVCNSIKACQRYIASEDKETLKIYRALKKRADTYLRSVSSLMGNELEFFAAYCGAMDEVCDGKVEALRDALVAAFTSYNVPKPLLLAHVELVRCLSEVSVLLVGSYMAFDGGIKAETEKLKHYRLDEIFRVATNLATWVQKFNRVDQQVNLKDCPGVDAALSDLFELFYSEKAYTRAMSIAIKEAKQ